MRVQADDKALHAPPADKAMRQPAALDPGNGRQLTGLPAARRRKASGGELSGIESDINPHYNHRPS